MNLEQTQILVDRALVTLCNDLPESLGLYNTVRDQFTIGALRTIPMLEHVVPESRKFHLIRDWMRSYEEHEDQSISNEISLDSLRQIMKQERKERVKEVQESQKELLKSNETKSKSNGTGKAKAKEDRNKAQRVRNRVDDSASDSDGSSTTETSSNPSSSDLSSDSDVEVVSPPRKSRSKSKEQKKGDSKTKRKRRSSSPKKRPAKSNLPPIEVVLSSDEDEEEEKNDLFDDDDPDVYEVECILDKRRGRDFGDEDMYLIKWVGYDDPTWEPAKNVSKDLIEEYEGQPVRENEYVVEDIMDRKTVRDKETKLKTFKYLVKWVGYDDQTWEPAENLPHNLRRKFDQKYEARKRQRTR
ncbi:hypothetical protein Poli38472_002848 [Pythium oligandrum]|uniref:Chromo domain-containing protein n=1 Tax=Pythium oligandrum TaxID=41045 RepID=A0A8K1FFL1_PYTOL|nr:hypothetical protein Poli38472_002848 [Pythium oligandrum]|eukprot:TMW56923.1 hypothetical protein Poli38472_002848 [Pythium oligandrum]